MDPANVLEQRTDPYQKVIAYIKIKEVQILLPLYSDNKGESII